MKRVKDFFILISALAIFLIFQGGIAHAQIPDNLDCNFGDGRFIRGEINSVNYVNNLTGETRGLGDVIALLSYLFSNGSPNPCMDAMDVNDNGSVNLADAVKLLRYLFIDGVPLPEPSFVPGFDPGEEPFTPGDPNIFLATTGSEFPITNFGNTSTISVTIENNGDTELNIISLSTSSYFGSDVSQFTLGTTPCSPPSTILPGSSCDVEINFTASDYNLERALLRIESDDPNEIIQYHLLKAFVPPPGVFTVLGDSLAFGDVPFGTSNPTREMILKNTALTGGMPFDITEITLTNLISNDISILSNDCLPLPRELAAQEECSVVFTIDANTPIGSNRAEIFVDTTAGEFTDEFSGNVVEPAEITVNPSSFSIPSLLIGDTSTEFALTVTNSVNAIPFYEDLEIESIEFFPTTSASDFSVVNGDCLIGNVLANMESCTFSFTYTPSSSNLPVDPFIRINSNASNAPEFDIPLTIAPPILFNPAISADPAFLTYPGTLVGATSGTQTVTLTNTQEDSNPLLINSITTGGAFSITADSCTSGPGLEFNESCSVDIIFSPADLGPANFPLTINSNDPNDPAIAVPLNGEGVAGPPDLAVSPLGPVDLGSIKVPQSSSPTTFTVSNQGQVGVAANLNLSSISLSGASAGQFQIENNNCSGSMSLAPGTTCTFDVTYAPITPGTHTANVQVVSQNDPTNGTIAISLTGQGTTPEVELNLQNINFPDQEILTLSSEQVIVVSNSGNANLIVSSANLSGANSSDFQITSNNCGTVLPGGLCNVRVVFSPSAAGTKNAEVVITTDDLDEGSLSIALTGTGLLPPPDIQVTPNVPSFDFGTVDVGAMSAPQIFTILNANSNSSPLTFTFIGNVNGSPSDFTLAHSCTSLSAGSACAIEVSFLPNSDGPLTTELRIESNDPDEPQIVIALTGEGQAPLPTCSNPNFPGYYEIQTEDQLTMMLQQPNPGFFLCNDIALTTPLAAPLGALNRPFEGNGQIISGGIVTGAGLFSSITPAGTVNNLTLENFQVTGNATTGALAGANFGAISSVIVSGTGFVSGTNDVGGLVGRNGQNSTGTLANIENCYVDSGISVIGSGNNVGGLVGVNIWVQNQPATGNITGSSSAANVSGVDTIGGLVGSAQTGSKIRTSFASGDVSGNQFVGGLVGNLAGGVFFQNQTFVEDSYAEGLVTGTNIVGGLIGNTATTSNSVIVRRTYVSGTVDSTGSSIGSLIGQPRGLIPTASFYDIDVYVGTVPGGVGTGLSTPQMQSITPFSSGGWSIDLPDPPGTPTPGTSTWIIDDGNDYPRLRWEQ